MSTTDTRVSPVIDLDRTNMQVFHNMIDNPSKYYSTAGTPTAVVTFKNSINSFSHQSLDFTTRSGDQSISTCHFIQQGVQKDHCNWRKDS